VTEPALYGVTLKYKKPLYAAMISGAINGLFMGLVNLKSFAFAVPSLVSLPQFVSKTNGNNLINAVIVLVASIIITFVLTLILGFEDEPETATAATATTPTQGTTAATTIATGTTKIYAPLSGKVLELSEVKDQTFAQKTLGDGVAIVPTDGKVYAPFTGEVMTIFPTKHAIGLRSNSGVELLIHIGLDTVNLKGAPFTAHVETGQAIKKGQLLMEVDLAAIQAAGYDITTPVVITNTSEFSEITITEQEAVTQDQILMYTIK
ncbi:PTS beta-glucoside transporter subunit IIBCA, partial [Lactobacillus sp. XV13L]|nr:PTS beta-glucoside transporter subunit IIBCA [Lactobacillus sp. XV13L]